MKKLRNYKLVIPVKKEMSWPDIVEWAYTHVDKVKRTNWIARARKAYDKVDINYLTNMLDLYNPRWNEEGQFINKLHSHTR